MLLLVHYKNVQLFILTWILGAEAWVEAGGKAWSATSNSGSKTYKTKDSSISNCISQLEIGRGHRHIYIGFKLNLEFKIFLNPQQAISRLAPLVIPWVIHYDSAVLVITQKVF